ncbi:SpaA isopeptide-forming pilin-related protein [Clostridium perfringens]|uniref:SpaA isopeptide-forming pilin-related protein n=2 Tax=Clostridium perfringens TaxID=1502 RepID=UPI0018E4BA0E|nr:SpaA isopeptide-forming pilin-related protein [Clostridium perfringens]MBI5977800.1 Cys-Gln thioester bond-forming surface protein [Clostridium perfringens]MBI5980731.1 Cys-Gln thioester bond-forming surface protein [Clostridium perfringens]MBI5983058.1 Cys-Gln thioester bond-forming surface protein [Clostridium perfringens]MBI5989403.1 Cys-Gln thioester bond-forming surface protein [Clostridium perfringens]MBI5994882.1 Cys-Gln thioester bond-forming surface protein [Clostridium perfringens
MSKAKRFKLITTITLIFTFLFTNIKVFAVEITSTDAESYLNYDSPTWGKVLPIGNHRYYVPGDLTTCYCLNTGALNPTGQDYTKEMQVDAGIETILYWGYPAKDGSDWGISADEYRYCTQLAIWAYQKEAGLSRGLVRERLQSGTVPLSKLKPVIDFLVDKAHNKEMPTFFEVSPNDIIAHQEGDYFVSEPIKIKSNYTLSGVKVTIKSASNPELTKDIVIKDMDGNVKDSGYKANESFRVYIPSNAETGDLKVSVKAKVDIPAMLGYMTPEQGIQDMAVSSLDTHSMDKDNIKVSWTGLNGAVQVIKKGDDGKLLTGAKFVLKNANGENVAEATSQDGKAVFNDIKPAEYTIHEVEAPQGYLVTNPVNVTVKPNKVSIAEMTDTQIKGKIQVLKVDEETNTPLQGAEFEITQDGKHIETITTGENGIATSSLLPFGNYLVKEIKAPSKYVLNGEEHPVTISENGKTIEITHTNKIIKGKVAVKKTDSEISDLNLEGAEFTIYDNNKNIVATITTNKDGYAESEPLNYGTYTMQETKAPKGYLLSNKVWDININENDKTYTFDVSNDVIKGKLQIVKVDSENEEKPVEGAGFDVIAVNVNGIKEGTVVDHVVTDKNGFAYTKDLRYGDYKFHETDTPKGYWKSDKEYSFNIAENGKTYVKYVKNSPIQAKVRVIKVDSKDGKPLKGVKFQIRNADTKKLVEFTNFIGIIPMKTTTLETNKNGELVTPQNLAYGNYLLEEVEPLEGYIKVNPIPFKIDENSVLEEIKDLGTIYTQKVSNDRITANMELLKLDKETNKPLENIEFKVTALDGFMKGKTWNLKSDDKGLVSLKGLEYGNYRVDEVKTLWNYVLNKEPIFFSVKENGKTIKLQMTNKKIRGSVELFKFDKDTNRPLEGVKFDLLNGDKKVGTYTTDNTGKITVNNLEAGNYTWVEVEAIDHYNKVDKKYDFNIYKDGQLKKIDVANTVKTGELDFSKTDVTTGDSIDGAKVKITGLEPQNKHINIEFTSSKEGNKFTLPEGKYTFEETLAPEGYRINKEVGTFEIKDGEITKANLKDERKQGDLIFTKTDVTDGKVIEGAKIKITCTEGLSKGKVIDFTSSKDGNKFTLDEGKYTFEETSAPNGYRINKEVGTFEIKDGEITKANLKDERKQGDLEFTKTDVTDGRIIEGAKIKIICVEGLSKGKVIEFTSFKDGNKFTLDEGKYTFEEISAPNGYEINKEVGTFEIKDGEITKANLKDERTTGVLEFTKTDVATGEVLEGAHIKIECLEGLDQGKVIEFASSKEGNKFTLAKGKYRISETKAPEGYELTTETGEFEITNQGDIITCNLTNKKIEIVKTGSSFDINSLIPLGVLLVAGGMGGLFFTKKRKLS